MNKWEALELFKEHGAVLEGHFKLSSGLHSDTYVQCTRVLQQPHIGLRLGDELAALYEGAGIDVVLSPAVGGIVIGYLVSMPLRKRSIFAERVDGRFTLRRGQELAAGERALLVEDVITTGGSVAELVELCRDAGAIPVGIAALVDRGGGSDLGVPTRVLLQVEASTWTAEECPLCREGRAIDSPGSRHI